MICFDSGNRTVAYASQFTIFLHQFTQTKTTTVALQDYLSNQSTQQRREQKLSKQTQHADQKEIQCRRMQPIDSDGYWLSHARTSSAEKV